jgi:hypothetical protein
MKIPNGLYTSIVLGTFSCAALAQSTVDLSITGSIVPVACTPEMTTNNMHFGKLSAADLHEQAHTALNTQYNGVSITCGDYTLFALRSQDNRSGTEHSKPGGIAPFGFGLTPADEKLGAYHLSLIAIGSSIDGRTVYFSTGSPDGQSWTRASMMDHALPNNGELLGLVDTAGVTSGPVPVKSALLRMELSGHIAPATGLTLTDEVPLDGEATLELVYL